MRKERFSMFSFYRWQADLSNCRRRLYVTIEQFVYEEMYNLFWKVFRFDSIGGTHNHRVQFCPIVPY